MPDKDALYGLPRRLRRLARDNRVAQDGPHPARTVMPQASGYEARWAARYPIGRTDTVHQRRCLTAKLTANPAGHRRNPGMAMNARSTVELHGRTAADGQGSAGPSYRSSRPGAPWSSARPSGHPDCLSHGEARGPCCIATLGNRSQCFSP
jgi:hypothetical protein